MNIQNFCNFIWYPRYKQLFPRIKLIISQYQRWESRMSLETAPFTADVRKRNMPNLSFSKVSQKVQGKKRKPEKDNFFSILRNVWQKCHKTNYPYSRSHTIPKKFCKTFTNINNIHIAEIK